MPGQTFAEALMFMERPSYPVSATALHASELIAFDSASFLDILRHSVDTCFRLMGDMSIWLHSRLNEIEALSVQNATLRLSNYLLRGAATDAQGSMDVELDIPKYVLPSPAYMQKKTGPVCTAQFVRFSTIQVKRDTGLTSWNSPNGEIKPAGGHQSRHVGIVCSKRTIFAVVHNTGWVRHLIGGPARTRTWDQGIMSPLL